VKTPRQTYTEARDQLEREATITISVTASLPDGTTTVADWPAAWEAPTYEDIDAGNGVDLETELWELVSQAIGEVVQAKLGQYPPPTAEELEELRARMIAMGIDPDDPLGPFQRLKSTLAGA
jgi:hypothetical protein